MLYSVTGYDGCMMCMQVCTNDGVYSLFSCTVVDDGAGICVAWSVEISIHMYAVVCAYIRTLRFSRMECLV